MGRIGRGGLSNYNDNVLAKYKPVAVAHFAASIFVDESIRILIYNNFYKKL